MTPNEFALELMIRPRAYVQRVEEEIAYVDSSTLSRSIRFTLDLSLVDSSTSNPPAVTLPLIMFARDRLLNDVPIVSGGGRVLTSLNRSASRQFQARVLRARADFTLRNWVSRGGEIGIRPLDRIRAAEWIALRVANIPMQSPKRARGIYRQFFGSDVAAVSEDLLPGLRVAKQIIAADQTLRNLCRSLCANEFIFVALPIEDIVGGVAQVTIAYESLTATREPAGGRGLLRRWLGAAPSSIRVHVPLAYRSQSYHVRMQGPPAHFVFEQSFRRLGQSASASGTTFKSTPDVVPLSVPEAGSILGAPTRPNSTGHLFASNLDSDEHGRLFAVFTFHEKPLGFTGTSAAVSAVLLLLLTAFLWRWNALNTAQPGPSTDLAAFLLAAPGALAAFVVPSMVDLPLTRGPLSARVGFVATIGLSVVAALVVALGIASTDWGRYFWCALIVLNGVVLSRLLTSFFRNQKNYNDIVVFYEKRAKRHSVGKAHYGVDAYGSAEYQFLLDQRRR